MQISLASYKSVPVTKRSIAEIDAELRDARPWMYRLALAIVGSPDTAEDVTQEALVRVIRSREKLRSVAEPRAWLRTVVVRCALTVLGKKVAESPTDQLVAVDPTESMAVRDTLSRLQPTDRAVLALAHFEELSYEEIGQALNIPVGTVGSRLHTAREAFRKEWCK